MEAAISVMSERGYAATSIQEVAERVGVLKGSLYHYFSSKEELLERILEESHRDSSGIAERIATLGLDPGDELFTYLHELAVWYLTHVERANIYFAEGRHLTGERRERVRERGRQFAGHIADLLDRARESGAIAIAVDPTIVRRFVIGSLNNVRTWKGSANPPAATVDELADAFVVFMRNALLATD